MKIIIRDAVPADTSDLLDLCESGKISGGTSIVPPLINIALLTISSDSVVRVAEAEFVGVVGFSLLEKSEHSFPRDSLYLSLIVIDSDFRGKGLGNMLVRDMIFVANKLAVRHSKKRLFAYTYLTPFGLISRKMALKNGFRPANRQRPDECYSTSIDGGEAKTDDAVLVLDLPYTPQQAEPPPAPPIQQGLVGLFKKLIL